jgi:hypothetical protein
MAFCHDLMRPLAEETPKIQVSTGFQMNSAAGMAIAKEAGVTIAMPISQGRISPLLDAAARLLLVTRRQGREVARKEFVLAPQAPEVLARSLAELRPDVLLCAAVSEPLRRELARHGVQIRAHLCGEIEEILQALGQHRLERPEFRMPGCWGRHSAGNCCRSRRDLRLLKRDFKSTQKHSKT